MKSEEREVSYEESLLYNSRSQYSGGKITVRVWYLDNGDIDPECLSEKGRRHYGVKNGRELEEERQQQLRAKWKEEERLKKEAKAEKKRKKQEALAMKRLQEENRERREYHQEIDDDTTEAEYVPVYETNYTYKEPLTFKQKFAIARKYFTAILLFILPALFYDGHSVQVLYAAITCSLVTMIYVSLFACKGEKQIYNISTLCSAVILIIIMEVFVDQRKQGPVLILLYLIPLSGYCFGKIAKYVLRLIEKRQHEDNKRHIEEISFTYSDLEQEEQEESFKDILYTFGSFAKIGIPFLIYLTLTIVACFYDDSVRLTLSIIACIILIIAYRTNKVPIKTIVISALTIGVCEYFRFGWLAYFICMYLLLSLYLFRYFINRLRAKG